uniref:Uncharacterized protein n=1 Tax=Anopheles gambiae TaxID=7165 RepID=A0A0E3W290_ANOGA
MDTSPGPSERRMQTFWACLSDASSGPSLNHELAELYGEPSILTVAKAGRIRWLGHVMRMPDSCPTKKVFDSDPQFGTRRRGVQRNWVSTWMRDSSQGPSILENNC